MTQAPIPPAWPVIVATQMRASACSAAYLLRTLANPDRLLLMCRLTEGEACVSDLERDLNILQPTLSQQLGVLREEKLVETRREGKHIYYRVKEGPALLLLQAVHQAFCKVE